MFRKKKIHVGFWHRFEFTTSNTTVNNIDTCIDMSQEWCVSLFLNVFVNIFFTKLSMKFWIKTNYQSAIFLLNICKWFFCNGQNFVVTRGLGFIRCILNGLTPISYELHSQKRSCDGKYFLSYDVRVISHMYSTFHETGIFFHARNST